MDNVSLHSLSALRRDSSCTLSCCTLSAGLVDLLSQHTASLQTSSAVIAETLSSCVTSLAGVQVIGKKEGATMECIMSQSKKQKNFFFFFTF